MVAVREICLGFDVGKATHQACAVCRTTGKVLLNDPLDNKEDSIDKVLGSAGVEALVVVDQKRNIGALVPERARSAGMDVAYLPGLPMKRSRDILPGIAKTNEIDAKVIAHTTVGMPWALRSVAEDGGSGAEIRLLAA